MNNANNDSNPSTARTVWTTQVFRYRLRPSMRNRKDLASHAGGARVAYNWALDRINTRRREWWDDTEKLRQDYRNAHPDASDDDINAVKSEITPWDHFSLCKSWTEYKDTYANTSPDERARGIPYTGWVANNAVSMYQSAIRNAIVADKNWMDSLTGRRRGGRVGKPKFKSKRDSEQSFTVNGGISLPTTPTKGYKNQSNPYRSIKLPRIGVVHTKEPTRKLANLINSEAIDCRECHGAGTAPDVPCSDCHGYGHTTCNRCNGNGERTLKKGPTPCKYCQSTGTKQCRKCDNGWRITKACNQCEGTGERDDGRRCRTCKGHGKTKCPVCRGDRIVAPARIVSATCTCDAMGRWHVSLAVERFKPIRAKTPHQRHRGHVGIDISTTGYTLSTGDTINVPHALRDLMPKIRAAQKTLSRRRRGSRSYERARRRLAQLHARVADTRRTYGDQVAALLLKEFDSIGIEGWSIADVVAKNDPDLPKHVERRRRRSMLDIGAGQLRTRMTLRSPWYDSHVVATTDYESTARTCYRCGNVRAKPIPLAVTEFRCDSCGLIVDRRVNSARVVAALTHVEAPEGEDSQNAGGSDISLRSPMASQQSEMNPEPATRDDAPDTTVRGAERGRSRTDRPRGRSSQPPLF